MSVSYDEILERVRFSTYGDCSFYDRKNQSLESFFQGKNENPDSAYPTISDLDDDFVELPKAEDVNEYSLMQNFVLHVQNEHAKTKLNDILQGKDAAKLFRKELHRLDLWQRYSVYRENAFSELVERWCAKQGISLLDRSD